MAVGRCQLQEHAVQARNRSINFSGAVSVLTRRRRQCIGVTLRRSRSGFVARACIPLARGFALAGVSRKRAGCWFRHSSPLSLAQVGSLSVALCSGRVLRGAFGRRRADGVLKRCFIGSFVAFASQPRVHGLVTQAARPRSDGSASWPIFAALPSLRRGCSPRPLGLTPRVSIAGLRPAYQPWQALAIRAGPRGGFWAQSQARRLIGRLRPATSASDSPARRPNSTPTGPAHTPSG